MPRMRVTWDFIPEGGPHYLCGVQEVAEQHVGIALSLGSVFEPEPVPHAELPWDERLAIAKAQGFKGKKKEALEAWEAEQDAKAAAEAAEADEADDDEEGKDGEADGDPAAA